MHRQQNVGSHRQLTIAHPGAHLIARPTNFCAPLAAASSAANRKEPNSYDQWTALINHSTSLANLNIPKKTRKVRSQCLAEKSH